MKKESGHTWKLGMFIAIGLTLFIFTIYFVGKQKNLFGSTFHLRTEFKTVSGLKVGNNVRFSGINVGTVNEIGLITDTSVLVDMVIRKEYQQFIKTDARASIGSDGLMGDKVLTISQGIVTDSITSSPVKNKTLIASKNAIEMEDVMSSLKASIDNAGVITAQLAEFSYKMNNGNGALSKLVSDEEFGKTLDLTMSNLQGATKGLNENMEAAQNNFLLKGFFKKKKRAEAKKQAAIKKQEELKKKNDLKKGG
jgi:phospholipid/cholesterol/gamma-HCH transport system substrate-binding protein